MSSEVVRKLPDAQVPALASVLMDPTEIYARVQIIQQLMKEVLIEGVHYGRAFEGNDRKFLMKAGAEKIAMTFQIRVDTEVVEERVTGEEVFYRTQATAYAADGRQLGSAPGVCSTDEEKYRWRKPIHQKEWDAAPAHLRRITWWPETGEERPQVRQEIGRNINTVLQMSCKRGYTAVIRQVTGASDIFDQELDDDAPTSRGRAPARPAGDLRVTGFNQKPGTSKSGKAYTLYTVGLSDGRTLKSFKDAVGKEADQAYHVGFPVAITTEKDNRGETLIATLVRVEAAAADPEPEA